MTFCPDDGTEMGSLPEENETIDCETCNTRWLYAEVYYDLPNGKAQAKGWAFVNTGKVPEAR